jgi:hypothetical protein
MLIILHEATHDPVTVACEKQPLHIQGGLCVSSKLELELTGMACSPSSEFLERGIDREPTLSLCRAVVADL